ncbi:MAG: hypothetical protein MZV70_51985 [Desulfobacterales bacterium]|nr:hypothetical protein [Desulfobacterales bacterium]
MDARRPAERLRVRQGHDPPAPGQGRRRRLQALHQGRQGPGGTGLRQPGFGQGQVRSRAARRSPADRRKTIPPRTRGWTCPWSRCSTSSGTRRPSRHGATRSSFPLSSPSNSCATTAGPNRPSPSAGPRRSGSSRSAARSARRWSCPTRRCSNRSGTWSTRWT